MLGESNPVCPQDQSTNNHNNHSLVDFQGDNHYLPNDPSLIFTNKIRRPPLATPTHTHKIDTILAISREVVPAPLPSPFQHQTSFEAAKFNSELIERFDFDLQKLFDAHPGTTISPGSEFRPVSSIARLLCHHPFWDRIQDTLRNGASYDFKPLPPDINRQFENDAILAYGNHASARKRPEALIKVCKKDTKFGYSFPISFDCARQIQQGRAGPLGVAQHAGIDEHGNIVIKDRLAHDQSFSLGFAPSLNDLVDESELIDLVFGWCLDRIIHQIVALRQKFPDKRILVCKFDWGSAYRRINGDGILVANTITTDVSGEFANLLTRLTFGGRPHPAMFSVFSEAACDLCNDVADLDEWDTSVCRSPLQDLMGETKRLDDSVPFHAGQPMAVDVEPRPQGYHDVYIDDMIQLFVDCREYTERAPGIVPLVLHLLVRPSSPNEPIDRNDILAEDKMKAEGAPSEEMRVLGWHIDTRRLLMRLPFDKFTCWSREVEAWIDPKRVYVTFKELESMLGKMIHACKGIPLALYHTKRTQELKEHILKKHRAKSGQSQRQNKETRNTPSALNQDRPKPWFRYKIPKAIKQDLRIWSKLLAKAHKGVSLNLLTCRRPTNVVLADSCPYGMGGFSVRTGKAWHVPLDPEIYALAANPSEMERDELGQDPDLKLSNNLFEFVCQVVTIWVDCCDGAITSESCVLGLSDSSSATGWMHKSSFGSNKPNHQRVSEKLTELVLEHDFLLHPEHIPGKTNVVTDLLSRTFDCCDETLTQRIHDLYPSQIPKNFRICPLPSEVQSWISSVAPLLREFSLDASNRPTKPLTGRGVDGSNTSTSSVSATTPFWTASRPFERDRRSSAPSCNDSEMELSQEGLRSLFEHQLSKRPLATWHRASGITTGRAPATSRDATGITP